MRNNSVLARERESDEVEEVDGGEGKVGVEERE
jgi:hypothetical protein